MATLERALNSIGKKCFIDYYEDFKTCKDKEVLACKLLMNNSNATSVAAQVTRINYAQWIFKNKKEREALSIIINSNRVDDVTKKKARKIYDGI